MSNRASQFRWESALFHLSRYLLLSHPELRSNILHPMPKAARPGTIEACLVTVGNGNEMAEEISMSDNVCYHYLLSHRELLLS